MKKYDVAAYIWPAYTGDEPRTRIFWPDGIGEWETVKDAKAMYPGHQWPRKPVWGYLNEADPAVMEMQIEQAVSHGVNVFIYDWYWYDNRPFLEQCLNNGFLKAKNHDKMKFYVMWANHDVTYGWDRRIADKDTSTHIWEGAVNLEQFKIIAERLIKQYFTLPCYYKIDGKPVLSIYDINNFVKGLGGLKETREAMQWFDEKARKAGLNGVHFQLVKWGHVNLSGFDGGEKFLTLDEVVKELPFESSTHYQFVHVTFMGRDYKDVVTDIEKDWNDIAKNFAVKYFPHVSIGWDNSPRYHKLYTDNVVKNNTPEEFKKALVKAKEFADKTNVNLITVNSWNEWTESSYLEPDDLYGYGYLDAVKEVFGK